MATDGDDGVEPAETRNPRTGPAGAGGDTGRSDLRLEPAVDFESLVGRLTRLLRIRTTPIAMKRFTTVGDMEQVPRLRRPRDIHTMDQIVAMAARLGWTVGVTVDDLVGAQCSTVVGLSPRDQEWLSGDRMVGVWYSSPADAAAHQEAMVTPSAGTHEAVAVSPLATGRLDPPDIAMVYATPGQMIILINGLQWAGYRRLEWGCVGESSCADSWGRALATGEPSLSIPCFAERRYGGVPDDELLMALSVEDLMRGLDGVEALARNGLRYPIPPYGIQNDARAGLGVSYG